MRRFTGALHKLPRVPISTRKYLCVPAASAPSNGAFGTGGNRSALKSGKKIKRVTDLFSWLIPEVAVISNEVSQVNQHEQEC